MNSKVFQFLKLDKFKYRHFSQAYRFITFISIVKTAVPLPIKRVSYSRLMGLVLSLKRSLQGKK